MPTLQQITTLSFCTIEMRILNLLRVVSDHSLASVIQQPSFHCIKHLDIRLQQMYLTLTVHEKCEYANIFTLHVIIFISMV